MRPRAPHEDDSPAPRPAAPGHGPLLRVAAFGLAFGVLSSALNHVGGIVAVYASKTVDTAWAWLFVAFLASLTSSGRSAFIRSIGLLTPALVPGFIASDALSLWVQLANASWADPYLVRVSLAVGLVAAVGTVVVLLTRTRRWLRSQKRAVPSSV